MLFKVSIKCNDFRKGPKSPKPIKMKQIFFNVFLLVILCLSSTSTVQAQNYHSQPTAMQNLQDELAYVTYQLRNVIPGESAGQLAAQEKVRYINMFIKALKTGMSVEEAANQYLPKGSLNTMQRSVKLLSQSYTGTTAHRYIRNEMLFLIAY